MILESDSFRVIVGGLSRWWTVRSPFGHPGPNQITVGLIPTTKHYHRINIFKHATPVLLSTTYRVGCNQIYSLAPYAECISTIRMLNRAHISITLRLRSHQSVYSLVLRLGRPNGHMTDHCERVLIDDNGKLRLSLTLYKGRRGYPSRLGRWDMYQPG